MLSIDPSIPIPTQNNTESENLLGESKVNDMPQFDNSMYTLEYFLKNGVREDLDLTHHNGEGGRGIPTIVLKYNAAIETIEGQLNGYCNQSSIKYKYKGNYFEVIDRGATTLSDCGGDEETEFFTPLSGNIYMQKPSQKVYYEIVGNNELHLWITQDHKLVFSKKTLTIGEESIDKMISVYPNPAKKHIRIESRDSAIMSIEVYNVIGKRVLIKNSNFTYKNQLDVSKFSRGVYFLKIHTKRGSVIKRLVLE